MDGTNPLNVAAAMQFLPKPWRAASCPSDPHLAEPDRGNGRCIEVLRLVLNRREGYLPDFASWVRRPGFCAHSGAIYCQRLSRYRVRSTSRPLP